MAPLYQLLKKGMLWNFNNRCEQAFQGVKCLLTSTKVLAHYVGQKS